MNINEGTNSITITLTHNQLWFLANFFAPGMIFGVDDPVEGSSESERNRVKQEALSALSDAGLLEGAGTNQVKMDEMLGGMVYSCVHSKDLLIVKTYQEGEQCFYHFLPDWQMAMTKQDEKYKLRLFKNREQVFPHVISLVGTRLIDNDGEEQFSVGARKLEMAVALYDSGQKQEAIQIFKEGEGEKPKPEEFLEGYINSKCHLFFDMLYDRNDEKLIHTMHHELMQTDDKLYWITKEEVGEEAFPYMHFTSIKAKRAKDRFNRMLPLD